jgi:pimeloyl-ACP methyl ester carboxylesterase
MVQRAATVGMSSDLRERLARTRFPDQAPGAPWAYGADVGYLQEIVAYWRDRFDWRAQEARLNAFPQFACRCTASTCTSCTCPRQGGPKPLPLLLSHGWPGSVFEFLEIIPRLTDPARFGGDPADAFTVVAPSLPGYGCRSSPASRASRSTPSPTFHALMTDVLGYRRFARRAATGAASSRHPRAEPIPKRRSAST